MIDQQTTIALAIKAGVIDRADTVGQYISQAYIDDLAHFANLVQQAERAETIKMLELYYSNLLEAGNRHEPYVIKLAIKLLEDVWA